MTTAALARAVVLALAAACGVVGATEPLRVCGDATYAPYEFLEDGRPRGANVDLWQALGQHLGRPVQVRLGDWAQAQKDVLEGRCDALSMATPTPQRLQQFTFSATTFRDDYALFVRRDRAAGLALRPTANVLIAVTAGGLPRRHFESLSPPPRLVVVPDVAAGLRKVVAGEVDAYGSAARVVQHSLKDLGLDVVPLRPAFAVMEAGIAVPHGNQALLESVNAALQRLRTDGSYERLLERWSEERVITVSREDALTATAIAVTTALSIGLGALLWRQHRRGMAREAAREAAERDAERKTRFVSQMSHEMRTPLTGLLGMVELTLTGPQTPAQRRHLDAALASGRQLLRVVNDLLDHEAMAAGALRIEAQPFDLAAVTAAAVRGVMPLAQAKGLSVHFDWVGEPAWFVGDGGRIAQIVTNLVSNAAKFTPAGSVECLGTVAAPVQGRCSIGITVRDSGPGIAPAVADRLFEPFTQLGRAPGQYTAGTGLGLAISRQLARSMGGDLVLDHDTTPGACFNLTLTLPTAEDPAPLPTPVAPQRLLLVQQETGFPAWLQRRLERLGWHCEVLPDVAAAVARAAAVPGFNAVVVNEETLAPTTDLGPLRRALPRARITVLVRPGLQAPMVEAQAQALGLHIAVRPLTPHELLALAAPEPDDARAQAGTPAAAATLAGEVLVAEDNPVAALLAETGLQALGLRTRCVADGAACVQACLQAAPDLLLLDLQMPVMDGLAAALTLRRLQREGQLRWFPIVISSAHVLDEERQATLAAGVNDFLDKPYSLADLRAKVGRWLGQRGAAG